jgi:hypothetical protein
VGGVAVGEEIFDQGYDGLRHMFPLANPGIMPGGDAKGFSGTGMIPVSLPKLVYLVLGKLCVHEDHLT